MRGFELGGARPAAYQPETYGEVMLGSHRTNAAHRPNPLLPIALLALLAAPACFAQQADGSGQESLQEIVVTSRLREEKLLDVPVSVSVFTEQTIKDAGIRNP